MQAKVISEFVKNEKLITGVVGFCGVLPVATFFQWKLSNYLSKKAKKFFVEIFERFDFGFCIAEALLSLHRLNIVGAEHLKYLNYPITIVPGFRLAGTVLKVLGLCLFGYSYTRMGSESAPVKEDSSGNSKIISKSPFSYVRYPLDTGYLLSIFGSILMLDSWILIPPALLILLSTAFRINISEKEMLARFGKLYLTFQEQTSLLFWPFF
eukprot:TRINITY_DN10693_c0_g1_i1.p1 TRINITY_DN10693_c0_g1~~TRINITY_DN10693_c0_g1_i1.p1  ORF type:complete len:225 (-),score=25.21 TRINITY_DN10693_c0_g1_i1:29-658(-)